MPKIQEDSRSPGSQVAEKPKDQGQAARSLSGHNFQDVVHHILDGLLDAHGIRIVRMPNRFTKDNPFLSYVKSKDITSHLLAAIRLPLKRPCDQKDANTYPDSDLVVIRDSGKGQWRVTAILSCKVSFRDRHAQACFWGLAFKAASDIKYFVVTLDAQDELGACGDGKEIRKRLETCTDGVFVIKKYKSAESQDLEEDIQAVVGSLRTNSKIFKSTRQFDPGWAESKYCRRVMAFGLLLPTLLELE